jgi:hypothetical protein
MGGLRLASNNSQWEQVVGCCEHGNELQDSTNSEEFLDYLTSSQEGLCVLDLFVSSTFYTECINKTPAQHVARVYLSATKCYVAREDIRNEESLLILSLAKPKQNAAAI